MAHGAELMPTQLSGMSVPCFPLVPFALPSGPFALPLGGQSKNGGFPGRWVTTSYTGVQGHVFCVRALRPFCNLQACPFPRLAAQGLLQVSRDCKVRRLSRLTECSELLMLMGTEGFEVPLGSLCVEDF